ncbi:aspartate kinase [Romboutsia sp. 13368]|uniref:aspartate kinase n=1 Tax=Romboutsia sp. 13368 TaxID=2708053 RepID=UPI002ED1EDA6
MSTVVHKYGGTSMGSIEKIKSVARKLISEKEKGNDVVVVVSAMGKTTNKLVELTKEISNNPDKREFDMLLSIGEQISISLLAIAIKSYGYDAISFTGYQAGIKTKGMHTKSNIVDIDIDKIRKNLGQGKIVIIAGFQGVNENGDITTLGRGGSDTTAVALAAKLGCDCTIYTDVEGIYPVDPKLYPNAKKLDYIGYKEMIEMSKLGAGVMETTSVEIGYKNNVSIYVASSSKDTKGTYITEKQNCGDNKSIFGIAINDNTSIFTIKNVLLKSNDMSLISGILSDENLSIKVINQISSKGDYTDFSLVISKGDLGCIDEAINKIKSKLAHIDISKDLDVTTISVVGGGINNNNIIANILEILKNNDIKFKKIITSELSISFIVDINDKAKIIELLGNEFNL